MFAWQRDCYHSINEVPDYKQKELHKQQESNIGGFANTYNDCESYRTEQSKPFFSQIYA